MKCKFFEVFMLKGYTQYVDYFKNLKQNCVLQRHIEISSWMTNLYECHSLECQKWEEMDKRTTGYFGS